MLTFSYEAIDSRGKQHNGVIEATSAQQARYQLRDQGLTPIAIEKVIQTAHKRPSLFKRTHLNTATLSLLTRQLATLLGASTPLDEALFIIAKQAGKPAIEQILMAVRARVREGLSFADALSEFPQVFSHLYCATVRAGEQTGHLERVLERLADYTEQQQTIKQKIQQALIYPSLITVVSVLVIAFLLSFVVPKMVSVFADSKQTLPFVTVILLAISHGVKSYGIYLLLGVFGLFLIFNRLIELPKYQLRWHKLILKLPLLGYTSKTVNIARFSRTLGILVAASTPVIDAMAISAQVVNNLIIRKAIELACQKVKEGKALYKALQQTGYFPPLCIYLIASGERSDQLEPMLERSASQLEDQIVRLINLLLTLFEPLMILFMGTVILFIVLAVLLPIFSLTQLIS